MKIKHPKKLKLKVMLKLKPKLCLAVRGFCRLATRGTKSPPSPVQPHLLALDAESVHAAPLKLHAKPGL